MPLLLLLLALIAAASATLFVQATLELSLLEHMLWWLMITLGLILLGWGTGLLAWAS